MRHSEYDDHLAYINDPHTRSAYEILHGDDVCAGFVLRPNERGRAKRRVHYRINERSRFAFIVAQRWLLFYVKDASIPLAEVKAIFPTAKETNGGEINLKVRNESEALLASQLIRKMPR